jgi:hypothetical protein
LNGRIEKAHRAAWQAMRGEIADGLHVLHHCDVPACVAIEHLFVGTHEDNVADCVSKGRNFVPRKLTVAQVELIRTDPRRKADIAAEFGISRQHVSVIQLRQQWRGIR